MQMIKREKDMASLNPSVGARIASYQRTIDSLTEKMNELKAAILKEMEAENVIKLETGEVSITYVAPTDRESFDSKAFRAANPALYDKYVSMTPVKASIRIKVKG